MKAVIVALALASCAQAAPKWLRYVGAAAVCTASAYDAYTTVEGGAMGLRERNPLLRGADGAPVTWRVSVLKSAQCGFAVWNARKEQASTARFLVNVGAAVVFGAVANHNRQLIDAAKGGR